MCVCEMTLNMGQTDTQSFSFRPDAFSFKPDLTQLFKVETYLRGTVMTLTMTLTLTDLVLLVFT